MKEIKREASEGKTILESQEVDQDLRPRNGRRIMLNVAKTKILEATSHPLWLSSASKDARTTPCCRCRFKTLRHWLSLIFWLPLTSWFGVSIDSRRLRDFQCLRQIYSIDRVCYSHIISKMFYDLNIPWSPSMPREQLLQTLLLARSLGYDTVALNHTITTPGSDSLPSPFPDFATEAKEHNLPNILHRATLPFTDPAVPTYRPTMMKTYDLIAMRPLTDKAFSNVCLSLDIPIISIDLTQYLEFIFRPKPCMAAVSRGVRFEINYAQALNADSRGRANFISNATNLIRATRGRGIMLSSEAKSALQLRAPADVVNLLNVWGLGNEKGMEGVGNIPRSVVVNEGMKRTGFRGVVDIVKTVERGPKEIAEQEAAKAKAPQAKNNKKQKRKNGVGDEADQANKKLKVVTREMETDKN